MAKAASFSEEMRLAHTLSLKQQSVWLQWAEVSEPFDLSWRNLIWGSLSTHVLKFFLSATVNWVRTPALLHYGATNKNAVAAYVAQTSVRCSIFYPIAIFL